MRISLILSKCFHDIYMIYTWYLYYLHYLHGMYTALAPTRIKNLIVTNCTIYHEDFSATIIFTNTIWKWRFPTSIKYLLMNGVKFPQKKNVFFLATFALIAVFFCISATIRIDRAMLLLLYAGFKKKYIVMIFFCKSYKLS